MPLDPSLDELSNQQPRGLPPPQPTPAWFTGAAEQQQRWGGTPSLGAGLQDIATSAGRGTYNAFGNFIENAVSGDPARQGAASGEFIRNTIGLPFVGGEIEGGLGALRMARAPRSDFFTTYGAKDSFKLISKETGKELGQFHTTYDSVNKNLKVDYMGSLGRTPGGNPWETHWGIGTHELQTLGPEILREYPDVQTVSFIRLPGIREYGTSKGLAGRVSRVMKYKVNRTPDGNITLERMESKRIGPLSTPTSSSPVAEPPPAPVSSSPAPVHGPGWTAEREESWDAMRQRQDAEWNAMMRRLFGR